MINAEKRTIHRTTVNKTHRDKTLRETAAYAGLRLCIVTHGSAVWQINEKLHTIQTGDIIFLSNRQKRRFVSYGEDGFSLAVFALDRRAFSAAKHYSFYLTCIQETGGIVKNAPLSAILFEVDSEFKSGEPSYELISAKLTEFFIKAERLLAFAEKSTIKVDKNMLRILDYIDEHITERITLAELAAMAGFTESSFSRWFAKQNGISFKKYVMSKKIEHAVLLLETTDKKVIDIAFECGFDSISGFYDTFRKVTGTTPNKYSYIV